MIKFKENVETNVKTFFDCFINIKINMVKNKASLLSSEYILSSDLLL